MSGRGFGVHSRRAAYVALALLTLVWGLNWSAMKAALMHAHPLVFNVHRTWLATAVLFAVLLARGDRVWPQSWRAVVVTGFFQTTINFGATTLAVAGGGAGRTSVLVFTMPFWTLLLAWPILHERVRALQGVAIAFAFAGLLLVVAPWSWEGDLAPKLWAVLSGFGWAAGTIAMKPSAFRRPSGGIALQAKSRWRTITRRSTTGSACRASCVIPVRRRGSSESS